MYKRRVEIKIISGEWAVYQIVGDSEAYIHLKIVEAVIS